MPPALQTHLDGCAACAQFAEQWLPGAPGVLQEPLNVPADISLRERILRAASLPEVTRFAPRQTLMPWIGRMAAVLVAAGFAYWLSNPEPAEVRPAPPVAEAAPTLTRSLVEMETQSKHQEQLVQTALVDGGRHVRGNVAWSVSALEL